MTFHIADRIRSRMRGNPANTDIHQPVYPAAYYMRGTLGSKREHASVSSQGLRGVERGDGQRTVWTDGDASLQFVFTRPRRIGWIAIVVDTGPVPNMVVVSINDGKPVKLSLSGRRVIRIRTSDGSKNNSLKLRIQSQTFAVQQIQKTSTDNATVGVELTEFQFAKYWWRLPLTRRPLAFFRRRRCAIPIDSPGMDK